MEPKTDIPGSTGQGKPGDPANADKTIAAVLGEIVWLISQSAEFKQYLISDLEWLVMPPILLRQFKLFYQGSQPVAVVLYARVSDEVAARIDAGAPTLRTQDWKSGETMKVVKVIAPFGEGKSFSDETIRFMSL
jgi:cytolysin-activating lysine-acyltransferase